VSLHATTQLLPFVIRSAAVRRRHAASSVNSKVNVSSAAVYEELFTTDGKGRLLLLL
jgi:hypothetical protein